MITCYVTRIIIHDFSRRMRKTIPNRFTFSVCVPSTLNLVSWTCNAPQEAMRKAYSCPSRTHRVSPFHFDIYCSPFLDSVWWAKSLWISSSSARDYRSSWCRRRRTHHKKSTRRGPSQKPQPNPNRTTTKKPNPHTRPKLPNRTQHKNQQHILQENEDQMGKPQPQPKPNHQHTHEVPTKRPNPIHHIPRNRTCDRTKHNENFWNIINRKFKDAANKEKDLLTYWFLIQKTSRHTWLLFHKVCFMINAETSPTLTQQKIRCVVYVFRVFGPSFV